MSRARAFTLLEMMLATALTTVLMVGVLAVVSNVAADAVAPVDAASEAGGLEGAAVDRWIDLLRRDLEQAVVIEEGSGAGVELVGYSVLGADGRPAMHRPVRVRYRLVEAAGHRWVVREQAALDVASNENVRRDLVCAGVARFELARQRGEASSAADGDAALEDEPRAGWLWRLRVWGGRDGGLLVERVLLARPGAGGAS